MKTGLLIGAVASAMAFAENMSAPVTELSLKEAQAENQVRLTIPVFPETKEEIADIVKKTLKSVESYGDEVANLSTEELSFDKVFGRLEKSDTIVSDAYGLLAIVANTHTDAELRQTADDAMSELSKKLIQFSYREDIYQIVKRYAATKPELEVQAQLYLEDSIKGYQRIGMHLPEDKKEQLKAIQAELTDVSQAFDQAIREMVSKATFSKEELAGVPEALLDSIKTKEGLYEVDFTNPSVRISIISNAKNEKIRKKAYQMRSAPIMEENGKRLTEIAKLRTEQALLLDYPTWADFKAELRMAEDHQTIRRFLTELLEGLQPKIKEEQAVLLELKKELTGDKETSLQLWDVYYLQNELKKQKYAIDTEALRVYFSMEASLQGMFDIYSELFGLKIVEVENPAPWFDGVSLHAVIDVKTEKPLGYFYLDMYPREGKYSHFAQFGIIRGRQEGDIYQRPTVALICNFPAPSEGKPSLLTLDEVETLYHEFGHVMHSLLTEAKFINYSGTSVARDFVEAPSQVLEYWLKSADVLNRFAADYRDSSKKFPQEVLDNLDAANKATIGHHYAGQIAYGLSDLNLHSYFSAEQVGNAVEMGNRTMESVYYAPPENSGFMASFGHMTGYDAGYYGYAWSDVIAADIASVFQKEDAYVDAEWGSKLRRFIFEPGGTRPAKELVEEFLGRKQSIQPFLDSLGIKSADK